MIGESALQANAGLTEDVRVTPAGPGPSRTRRVLQATVLAAPLVIASITGWAHRIVVDDGFIYFRVVRQITEGNGPVFNSGERVEAFTGPLWVAILTVADVVTPIRLEWLAVGLGLALSIGGLALAMGGARLLVRSDAPTAFLVPFGVFVFVVLLPVWIFYTSGLETGLTFAWQGASLLILADWARRGRSLSVARAALLGIGWLVRPELIGFSVIFIGLVLIAEWHADTWFNRGRLLISAFALPIAYEIFRLGYYGSLVANTAIAKEGTNLRWDRGSTYFHDFVDPYWLWIPAVLLIAGGYVPLVSTLVSARRRRSVGVVGAFAIAGILDLLYVIAVGGDYLQGRLFLPAVFALCAPVAVVPLTRRYGAALAVAPWLFACAFFLRPPQARGHQLANFVNLPLSYGWVTVDDFGWGDGGPKRQWYTGPGYYIQAERRTHRRVDIPLKEDVALPVGAFGGVGVIGYAMGPDFYIVDTHGLGDAFGSHLETKENPTQFPRPAGHDKPVPPAWIAARLTPAGADVSPEDFPAAVSPLIPVTTGAEFQEQVAWARAALRCPEIRQFLRAATAPMTPRLFVSNIVHAPERTRVRIPPDPEAAYRKFCGSDTPPEVEGLTARARSEP